MIKTNLYEYPYGDKWFCIVWDDTKNCEYIIKKDEAEQIYPDEDIRKAVKKLAIAWFKNGMD